MISAEVDAQPPNAAHYTTIAELFRMARPPDPVASNRNLWAHARGFRGSQPVRTRVSPAGSRTFKQISPWASPSAPSSTKAAGFKCYLAARPNRPGTAAGHHKKHHCRPSLRILKLVCKQCRQNRKCCYPADERYRHTEPGYHLALAFSLTSSRQRIGSDQPYRPPCGQSRLTPKSVTPSVWLRRRRN